VATPVPRPGGLKVPPAAALACVPGLEDGRAPLALEQLPDGTVNDVYRVDTAAGRFVLRVDGAEWRRPGVDREREAVLHALAAAAGLAPPILRRCPQRGVLITPFLPGRTWTPADFADAHQLLALGERLAALHALPPPALRPFDPLGLAAGYVQAAGHRTAGAGAVARTDVQQVMERLAAAVAVIDAAARPAAIVHGDLVNTNLLQGERLWLLDFEYAQLADPAYDVGCVLAYYPAAAAHAAGLLAAACPGAQVSPAQLEAARAVHAALAWLWHLARGETPVSAP